MFPGLPMPAMWQHGLQNWSPGGRYLGTLGAVAEGSLYPAYGKPEMDLKEKVAWVLTGGKMYPLDRGRAMFYKNRRLKTEENALKRNLRSALRRGDMFAAEFYRGEMRDARQRRFRASARLD